MKKVELYTSMLEFNEQVDTVIDTVSKKLMTAFASDNSDNEQVMLEANVHSEMVIYMISSSLASKFSKLRDNAKTDLDTAILANGTDPTGRAGETLNLFESNFLKFTKRQNKDGEQCTVTEIVNQLNRLGVEASIIKEAVNKATKPKRGNTYYMVDAVEE